MPLRASNRDIGTSVGKMIFHGKTAKGIMRSLKGADQSKLSKSLERRGLGHLSHEKIADVLSGKDRAGLRHGELKGIVESLQSSGLASAKRTASEMVTQASREAQLKANPGLTPEAIKRRLKGIAVEQRVEANLEEQMKQAPAGESVSGILDRMRGAQGRANSKQSTTNNQQLTGDNKQASPERMKLQPRFTIPKPTDEGAGTGFQA